MLKRNFVLFSHLFIELQQSCVYLIMDVEGVPCTLELWRNFTESGELSCCCRYLRYTVQIVAVDSQTLESSFSNFLLLLIPIFWVNVCKTVLPILSDHCPVCLSVCLSVLFVCNVAVLWPNGWMDEDETWHAGRTQAHTGHIVLGEDPASHPKRGTAPQVFRPMSVVAKWLDGLRCHLVWR